jgi:hypothetical protein
MIEKLEKTLTIAFFDLQDGHISTFATQWGWYLREIQILEEVV